MWPWWIGVDPANQGRGGGDALNDAVEAAVIAAAGRVLVIDTSALPPLARARTFYTKRRYAECERVSDFYGVGDDKVIFAKRISAISPSAEQSKRQVKHGQRTSSVERSDPSRCILRESLV